MAAVLSLVEHAPQSSSSSTKKIRGVYRNDSADLSGHIPTDSGRWIASRLRVCVRYIVLTSITVYSSTSIIPSNPIPHANLDFTEAGREGELRMAEKGRRGEGEKGRREEGVGARVQGAMMERVISCRGI